MLWKFKNNKNATEKAWKISSVYGQDVIADRQVRNWFSKVRSSDTSMSNEPRPGRTSDFDQDALTELLNVICTKVIDN